jgi:hypothetical protein
MLKKAVLDKMSLEDLEMIVNEFRKNVSKFHKI